jgi:hypothetical protein
LGPSRSAVALSFCTLLGALLSLAPRAGAHAPPEVWHVVSRAPEDVILATNRGLIFGNLNTQQWSLLCNEAFGADTTLEYRAAQLPSGRILVAVNDGLYIGEDHGCTWRKASAPMAISPDGGTPPGVSTPFLVQDPALPDNVYVATYALGAGGVQLTSDGGETFSKLLAVDDVDYVGSLLLAPGSPVQLYAEITRFPPMTAFTYFVAHSSDGGKTWDRNQVQLTSSEVDLRLLAVNPLHPEQLVARASAAEPSNGERVLFSRDGGKTFSSPITVRALRAAAFSHDGNTLYIGGVDGVQRARVTEGELVFEPVAGTARISDFEQSDTELLACGYYQGLDVAVDGVGSAPMDQTATVVPSDSQPAFTHWLDFSQVQDSASCPAPSTVEQTCALLFRDWLIEESPPALDAGVRDGGSQVATSVDAGAAAHAGDAALRDAAQGVDDHHTASGCTLAPDSDLSVPGLALGLLGLTLSARRRRRAG